MSYAVGDKVTVLPTTRTRSLYRGQPGTVARVVLRHGTAINQTYATYAVIMDSDRHVFSSMVDEDLEPYAAPIPERISGCHCDLTKGGCTCEIGAAELAEERERMQSEIIE